MPLILAFVELLGGVILLTSGITTAPLIDVIKGHALTDAQAAAAGTPAASAQQVNTATGAVGGPGRAGLTAGQQMFASELAARTGLNPGVITAWLLAEESGAAAASRQAAGNHDWLNIGYTDTATYGAQDSVWSDPVSAADATAAWLQGQASIPGYGRASSGVQAILHTAGQSAMAQIRAIQTSGWASSGYPDLPTLYSEVTS